tara:strand:- start:158 stop:721 length:564 start_codon:yes stop_codon:yes gene_type:complete
MSNCNDIVNQKYKDALRKEYLAFELNESVIGQLVDWVPTQSYPVSENVLSYQQNLAIIQRAINVSTNLCATPCKPNRIGAGKYYGSAANCKNDGTQGSCYMHSYPDPSSNGQNPLAKVGSNTRRFARNVIPTKANAYGLRLLFNNNKFSLTGSSKGMVGTSSGASRAINRGRASARNAAKVSYKNSK